MYRYRGDLFLIQIKASLKDLLNEMKDKCVLMIRFKAMKKDKTSVEANNNDILK